MPPLNVLIVEDEILVALDAALLLEEAGCRVVGTAATAAHAAELAAAHAIDLVFTDLNLEDGPSGAAVAAALAGRGADVVFTTANPEQVPADMAGALGVVSKPYAAETLVGVARYVEALRRGCPAGPLPRALFCARKFRPAA